MGILKVLYLQKHIASFTLLISVYVLCLGVSFSGASAENESFLAGFHCGNVTYGSTEVQAGETNSTVSFLCVECMFHQNCLSNNNCLRWTAGAMCEKCIKTPNAMTYRVGNSCSPCPQFPWQLVSLTVFLLVLLINTYRNGFTTSVASKVKLVCNFLQCLVLAVHIKVAWPDMILQMIGVINFSFFSFYLIAPECMFPSWPAMLPFYMDWLILMIIPPIALTVGALADKRLKLSTKLPIDHTGNEGLRTEKKNRRTTARRVVIIFAVVMYAPVTLAAVRTYLCSETVPKKLVLNQTDDVFLLDNSVSCNGFVFQVFQLFGGLYLMLLGVLFPLLIVFFTLRQNKWSLLYSQWHKYSPVYETYKDKMCFWETVQILRKLVAIVITEMYPFTPLIQACVQMGVTGVYLLMVLLLRPFRSCYWIHPIANIHHIFEVLSTIVILLTQAVAFSLAIDRYLDHTDIALLALVGLVLTMWLVTMVTVSLEKKQHIPTEEGKHAEETVKKMIPVVKSQPTRNLKFWKKKKVGPNPEYLEQIEINKRNIDF
ncbi:uncharacterized protein LOC127861943 isoform X2 [Dreissena polymorpha]|uniref:uncharacterized protein LOC127861943 isoform X2 n=1 Tax=Dreissena polymorpha TaxID=45954 RepID=UPI002264A255|nr:uncharacterized protein LOC127861943 isoform X2 [Dreissena polymorpha]